MKKAKIICLLSGIIIIIIALIVANARRPFTAIESRITSFFCFLFHSNRNAA